MELIVDNFAGGGGASTGIEIAIGRAVDIAINHDESAIEMHKANHPDTEHFCESVWDVDPVKACRGRKVALAWFSPDCKHFSKAKGTKPVNKNIRGLAWVALKWAGKVKPRIIMLENVEEFTTWGPLVATRDKSTGRVLKRVMHDNITEVVVAGKGERVPIEEQLLIPDKKRQGKTFKAFVSALEDLGYKVEWKTLIAADYGAPTSRKRLFLIARCDGFPICWPSPTHGNPDNLLVQAGIIKPWRTASEIIDWSIPTKSIFGRKKPLSQNTMNRIAKGLKRFIIDNPEPFIVRIGQTGFGQDKLHYGIDKPLTTVTSKAEHCLVVPSLIKVDDVSRVTDSNVPRNHDCLITSHIVKMKGDNIGQPVTEPLQTITAGGNHFAEVRAFLVKYYGSDVGQRLDVPLHTITTKDRFGLVVVKGELYEIEDIGFRMIEPHELYRAHAFPDDYIIDMPINGKKCPKKIMVEKVGNSVTPPLSTALVRANLPELCQCNDVATA